jgi:hypothetical protein
MRVAILKTDNGDHSPKQWAYATASRLIEVDSSVVDDRFLAAQELQLAVTRVLIKHHTDVQDTEYASLMANGDAHLQTEVDVQAHVDAAFADVVAAAKGTDWESLFDDSVTQASIRHLLEADFSTSKHLKRAWHIHHKTAQQ